MQQKQATNKYLIAGIVTSMFLWGLSWPSGKVLTHYCSVANFTIYRYLLVVITIMVLLACFGISFRIRKAGIPAVIGSGTLLAVYSYFFFMGLKNGAAGAGGVLVTTLNPIFAYALGMLLNRKLPGPNEAIGLVLGLIAGCILLKVWNYSSALWESGNLYFLLASLSWALLSKFTSKGAQYGSSLTFSLWQYLVTLLCLLPFLKVPELQAAIHIKAPVFWINLVFSAVFVTALATTLYFYSTTRLGAEKASSFIFLVPFAAAISSWFLLGEKLHLHTVIGGALGMVAVYIINKKRAAAAS